MAIQACGGASVRLLALSLHSEDYADDDAPWERILSPMHGLVALSPWKRVMDSIGPVDEDNALGGSFRKRVQDFDSI